MQKENGLNILVSVTNQRNLYELRRLCHVNARLIATRGTLSKLRESGMNATLISEVTGCEDMLGGVVKVKCLHHRIFVGIGADRQDDACMKVLEDEGIMPIDAVFSNFYNFIGNSKIKNIDLAAAIVLAAVKNGSSVVAVVDPDDYKEVVDAFCKSKDGTVPEGLRERLAIKAINAVVNYYASIARWMEKKHKDKEPIFA